MVANYISTIYDLNAFGIFSIKNAMVNSDKDDGIKIEVSFNGGSTFQQITPNKKFPVSSSNGKIQVRISFEEVSKYDIYKIKTNGYFQNLDIGTTINFTKISTSEVYSTNVGRNGYYSIFIPRGIYEISYNVSGNKVILLSNYNPEISYIPTQSYDKESIIENTFRDVEWAKFSIFDTFSDMNKMLSGNAIIDSNGNLSDGITNRKCRYWVVIFE